MAHNTPISCRAAFAVAALAPFSSLQVAQAQSAALSAPVPASAPASAASTSLAPVTITGKAPPSAAVAGWDDVPLSRAPVQATSTDAAQLRDAGVHRLADLVRLDASVGDSYNAEGYIDYFTVRGFVIDNRFNFRRDGLPINAETSIPLENKARVDILEGLSGIQAGTSAPGGLVDIVVKRPLEQPLRSAFLEWRQRGSIAGAVDISQRFGRDDVFGLRLNAGAERIDPIVHDANGHRSVLAIAGDWRATASTLIEVEAETSHRAQPSVPGFSLLGNGVPAVPDPKVNLNDQPWSLPVVFDATTASLRITHRLNADWRVVAHALTQGLRTDDRIAFPFGCGDAYQHSFCPNGDVDLYDFRSENERRRSNTLDLSLHGKADTGPLVHALTVGFERNLVRNRFQGEAYNKAGTGNIDGTVILPPMPDPSSPNTNRDERTSELYVRDAISLGERDTLWLGARHTSLSRAANPTDGSEGTSYRQSFTTPFAALSHAFAPMQIVYASWGRGVESDVAPQLPQYANHGEALPAARSRQFELGTKGSSGSFEWSAAASDILEPHFGDVPACDPNVVASCVRTLVGSERHRGFDAGGTWRSGAWDIGASAQWLHARIESPDLPESDGQRPTNVPATTLRLQTGYRVAAIPGLRVQAAASYDSAREVLPDNSVQIPGFVHFDLGARHEMRIAGVAWTLRAGVDNVFDKRAWRESPYQYDHAYLFPLAPRTFRASLQADL